MIVHHFHSETDVDSNDQISIDKIPARGAVSILGLVIFKSCRRIRTRLELTNPAKGSAMGPKGFAWTNFAALLFGAKFCADGMLVLGKDNAHEG